MGVPLVAISTTADYEGQVRAAGELLVAGKLVVLPTETVYGVAGLLSHPDSLTRLKAIRGKSNGPFTIHVARPEDAEKYLGEVTDLGRRMMKKLWPGPVALVFDVPAEKRAAVAASLGVAEGDLYDAAGTITLRCPDHGIAEDVIGSVDGPVVVTAAGNDVGSTTTSPAPALADELDGKVDLILDGGPTRYSQPSTIVKLSGDKYEVVRKGVYDERIIARLMRTTILFVCSGNTCRSPMAEALARRALAEANGVPEPELDKKGLAVASAGAFAMPGSRATPAAAEAVKAMGADLSAHRSRQLTPELIHQADVIFTMGRSHAMAVAAMVPAARRKVATLDPDGDIDDPIGGDISLYRDLAGELQKLIERRLAEQQLLVAKTM